MPSASVNTTMVVNPGFLRSNRRPNRMSCKRVSPKLAPRISRHSSRTPCKLPNRLRAARAASSRDIPAAMFSAVRCSRWKRSSSSISCFTARCCPIQRRQRRIFPSSFIVSCRLQNQGNSAMDPLPDCHLGLQLPAACPRQRIEFRPSVILRFAPLRRNPTFCLLAVEARIKRPLLHNQHLCRSLLDALGDGVTMHRPGGEGLENEQIQGSLEQLSLGRRCHSVSFIDILGEYRNLT